MLEFVILTKCPLCCNAIKHSCVQCSKKVLTVFFGCVIVHSIKCCKATKLETLNIDLLGDYHAKRNDEHRKTVQ